MKKTFLLLLITALSPAVSFAQFEIKNDGQIKMNTPFLDITTDQNDFLGTRIQGNNSTLLYIIDKAFDPDTDIGYREGISLNMIQPSNHFLYGINSFVQNGTNAGAIGLLGTAKGKSGYSYGVFGCLNGNTTNGAGIYGTVGSGVKKNVDGKYAGYFDGNIKVTGTINGTLLNSSDARLKDNINTFAKSNTLNKLSMLSPISYNYKKEFQQCVEPSSPHIELSSKDMITGKKIEIETEIDNIDTVTHFGLLAQELQQIYPNLVYQQDNGYLAINYIELIPVMLQAINELNAKVEELSVSHPTQARAMNATSKVETEMENFSSVTLGQNSPNPFSERTEIAITLPESVQKAILYIYDMTGKQVEQHEITGRGNTSMTIYADRMDAGMYIYALVADGKVITSKKMIVTK